MATDSSKNSGHVAFSDDVDVDIEEATPVPKGPTNRQSLSQSAKAWDIDGDGKLDPTELALKDIDQTGKGTLSKEQMYELMNQNLSVQKELTKVKKFVIGLVVLTGLLALANVGMSFAAAYLAKDTKTVEGKLVVSSSGETVKTDSTTQVFMVDADLQERVSHERSLYHGYNGGSAPWANFPFNDGRILVANCKIGGTIAVGKIYIDADGAEVTKTHQICPPTTIVEYTNYGEDVLSGNTIWGMTITKDGAPDITVHPLSDRTYYAIDGLGAVGDTCNILNDCGANMACDPRSLVCVSTTPLGDLGDKCTETVECGVDDNGQNLVCSDEGLCRLPLGSQCYSVLGDCSSNLRCEGTTCVGLEGASCDKDDDCSFVHTCSPVFKVCTCKFKGASCGTDGTQVCSTTDVCGQYNPDVVPSCQQKSKLNDSCRDGSTCQVRGLDDHTCQVPGLLGAPCTDTTHDIVNDCGANMKCEGQMCVPSIGYELGIACGSNLIYRQQTSTKGICMGLSGHVCVPGADDCDYNLECEKANPTDVYGICW